MDKLLDRIRSALSEKYDVERELGRGGSGTVFLARDLKHDRPVAIKVLNPDLAIGTSRDRFEKEISYSARLTHPNILQLIDSGDAEGHLYFVMPFIEGESLRDLLAREKRLSIETATRITSEVAGALAYAHGQGVLHRDIKPENILIAGGHAVVSDFGIARAIDAEGDLTLTGVLVGTPAFMSPEQASGAAIDERTDLYSLGCIFYEMIAGQPPFVGPDAASIIRQHQTTPAPDVTSFRPDLPPVLSETIRKLLAKVPADRYDSAEDLLLALENPAVPRSSDYSAPKPHVPRKLLVGLGSGLALAVVAILFITMIGKPSKVEALAVLPLDDLSETQDRSYFANGLTDELINQLAQIPDLRVISRTSSARFKATNLTIPEIAQALDVDVIVEGSVLHDADRVRVTVQLIRAKDDSHVWSRSYERDLRDILAVQNEMSTAIAGEIRVRVAPSWATSTDSAKVDPAAYRWYLRGRDLLESPYTHEAKTAFEKAIELDRDFAPAYAGLAEAYSWLNYSGHIPLEEMSGPAREAARIALSLDESLAEAHRAIGYVYLMNWDWTNAEQSLMRSADLMPSSPKTEWLLAVYAKLMGRDEEYLRRMKRAYVLNPRSDIYGVFWGSALLSTNQTAAAIRQFEQTLDEFPEFYLAKFFLGIALVQGGDEVRGPELVEQQITLLDPEVTTFLGGYLEALLGNRERAQGTISTLEGRHDNGAEVAGQIATLYGLLNEKDKALDWLEKACDEHDSYLIQLEEEVAFDDLRDDARYHRVRERMGLNELVR